MATQTFRAQPHPYTFPNGAIGWRAECVGPYAKVRNCPIDGTDLRLTAYASAYPDSHFSVPAVTRYRGQRVKGFFSLDDDNCIFVPNADQTHKLAH